MYILYMFWKSVTKLQKVGSGVLQSPEITGPDNDLLAFVSLLRGRGGHGISGLIGHNSSVIE